MTLILTVGTPAYVVQVSDRRLTIAKDRKLDEFDPIANKTVVYRAADALVSIGYSGIAYIGRTPTDQWISELLWGAPVHYGPDGKKPAICIGRRPNSWKIGYATKALHDGITALATKDVEHSGLYLTIAGWQGGRGQVRPIVVEIERHRRSKEVLITRSPRVWPRGKDFCVHSIGAHVDSAALKDRFAPFRANRSLLCEDVESVLVEFVKEVAANDKAVGPHVLSVVLRRPGTGISECRFREATPHLARLTSKTIDTTLRVAHSPWFNFPGLLHPPSMEIGDSMYDLGGVDFTMHGAKAIGPVSGLSSSILRKPFPAKK